MNEAILKEVIVLWENENQVHSLHLFSHNSSLKQNYFWAFGISLMVLRRRGAKGGSCLPPPPPPRPHIHSSFPLHFTSGPHPTRVHKAGLEGSPSHFQLWGGKAVACLKIPPGLISWEWRRASYSLQQSDDGALIKGCWWSIGRIIHSCPIIKGTVGVQLCRLLTL